MNKNVYKMVLMNGLSVACLSFVMGSQCLGMDVDDEDLEREMIDSLVDSINSSESIDNDVEPIYLAAAQDIVGNNYFSGHRRYNFEKAAYYWGNASKMAEHVQDMNTLSNACIVNAMYDYAFCLEFGIGVQSRIGRVTDLDIKGQRVLEERDPERDRKLAYALYELAAGRGHQAAGGALIVEKIRNEKKEAAASSASAASAAAGGGIVPKDPPVMYAKNHIESAVISASATPATLSNESIFNKSIDPKAIPVASAEFNVSLSDADIVNKLKNIAVNDFHSINRRAIVKKNLELANSAIGKIEYENFEKIERGEIGSLMVCMSALLKVEGKTGPLLENTSCTYAYGGLNGEILRYADVSLSVPNLIDAFKDLLMSCNNRGAIDALECAFPHSHANVVPERLSASEEASRPVPGVAHPVKGAGGGGVGPLESDGNALGDLLRINHVEDLRELRIPANYSIPNGQYTVGYTYVKEQAPGRDIKHAIDRRGNNVILSSQSFTSANGDAEYNRATKERTVKDSDFSTIFNMAKANGAMYDPDSGVTGSTFYLSFFKFLYDHKNDIRNKGFFDVQQYVPYDCDNKDPEYGLNSTDIYDNNGFYRYIGARNTIRLASLANMYQTIKDAYQAGFRRYGTIIRGAQGGFHYQTLFVEMQDKNSWNIYCIDPGAGADSLPSGQYYLKPIREFLKAQDITIGNDVRVGATQDDAYIGADCLYVKDVGKNACGIWATIVLENLLNNGLNSQTLAVWKTEFKERLSQGNALATEAVNIVNRQDAFLRELTDFSDLLEKNNISDYNRFMQLLDDNNIIESAGGHGGGGAAHASGENPRPVPAPVPAPAPIPAPVPVSAPAAQQQAQDNGARGLTAVEIERIQGVLQSNSLDHDQNRVKAIWETYAGTRGIGMSHEDSIYNAFPDLSFRVQKEIGDVLHAIYGNPAGGHGGGGAAHNPYPAQQPRPVPAPVPAPAPIPAPVQADPQDDDVRALTAQEIGRIQDVLTANGLSRNQEQIKEIWSSVIIEVKLLGSNFENSVNETISDTMTNRAKQGLISVLQAIYEGR